MGDNLKLSIEHTLSEYINTMRAALKSDFWEYQPLHFRSRASGLGGSFRQVRWFA